MVSLSLLVLLVLHDKTRKANSKERFVFIVTTISLQNIEFSNKNRNSVNKEMKHPSSGLLLSEVKKTIVVNLRNDCALSGLRSASRCEHRALPYVINYAPSALKR